MPANANFFHAFRKTAIISLDLFNITQKQYQGVQLEFASTPYQISSKSVEKSMRK